MEVPLNLLLKVSLEVFSSLEHTWNSVSEISLQEEKMLVVDCTAAFS